MKNGGNGQDDLLKKNYYINVDSKGREEVIDFVAKINCLDMHLRNLASEEKMATETSCETEEDGVLQTKSNTLTQSIDKEKI